MSDHDSDSVEEALQTLRDYIFNQDAVLSQARQDRSAEIDQLEAKLQAENTELKLQLNQARANTAALVERVRTFCEAIPDPPEPLRELYQQVLDAYQRFGAEDPSAPVPAAPVGEGVSGSSAVTLKRRPLHFLLPLRRQP